MIDDQGYLSDIRECIDRIEATEPYVATMIHNNRGGNSGGGYIFVHRMLMEHFASLYDEKGKATR